MIGYQVFTESVKLVAKQGHRQSLYSSHSAVSTIGYWLAESPQAGDLILLGMMDDDGMTRPPAVGDPFIITRSNLIPAIRPTSTARAEVDLNSSTTDAVVADLIPQNQTDHHSRGRQGNREVYKRRAPDIVKLPVVHTTTDYTTSLFSPMAYSKLAEKDMKNETKRPERRAQVPRIIMLTIQAVLFVLFFPFLLFFSMWQAMRSRGAPTVTRLL